VVVRIADVLCHTDRDASRVRGGQPETTPTCRGASEASRPRRGRRAGTCRGGRALEPYGREAAPRTGRETACAARRAGRSPAGTARRASPAPARGGRPRLRAAPARRYRG
jgi:hypothetical protein